MKSFLTVKELKIELGIGDSSVYQLVNRADFPTIRVGRKILIPTDALKAWVERNTTGAQFGRA